MANENRRKLYNAINQAGYDIGDYDEFDKRMNNAADRQKFFQAVNDAGYDIGSQEEFERRISPSKYKLKTGGKYIPVGEREYKDFVSRKSGSQKPSQPSNFQQTIDNALATVSQARQTVNRIGNKEKQIGLNVPKSDFGRVDIGKNRKVTTKGNRYVTEAGNEYENRAMADMEQYAIDDARRRELDPIGTQLEDAYAERDRIDDLLKSRIEEIEKERSREGFLSGMLREAGAASRSDMLPDATSLSMDLESDREYSSLMAAARKNKELITTLEDQRDKKTNDFWHSLGTEITNGYTFSLGGKAKMDDITSLMEARKHLDTINQKRSRGESLTHDEEVAETVLKNNEWDRQIQSQYGDDYGAWARAGKMGANSADFMLDFLMMGGAPMNVARGVMNAIVKGGENMIGNAVAKGFGRFMLKSTGATLGSMVAGAQITNTIQLGKTGSDIAQSMIGDVYQDAQGNFVFGHYEGDENGNPRFVKGGNSFLTALADAERAGISENGSEVLGTFLPGAGKVFQDLGLSKIARGITALKGKGWYQNYSKFLQTAGFNGVAGEGLEEYGGMVLDALMGGDEWKKIADPRTHLDIWLGVSTMAGMLNAPNVIGTGYSALQYQRYKKATNLADVEASSVIPSGTWDALRETIDATDNTTMADVAMDILSNEELTSEGKRAAMDYIDKLQKMRGYSLGSIASGKPQDDEEEPIDDESRDLDEGYTEGYDTQDADMMKQFSDEAQSAEELLPSYGSKFAEMVISGDAVQTMDYLMRNRNIFTDEQIEAAADYYQKKAREDGMLDGVIDRVDLDVARADAQVRSEMHRASNQRIIATSGDNVYYITAGEVGTDPETGNVILIGTGGAVVGRDISTGATEVLNPSNVQLYSVETVDDLINYNHTTLRQKLMQQADDDITYGSPAQEVFEQEDTVTLNDGQGGVIEGQIGMLPNSVDGVYVVYTNDGRALQLTEDDLNRRIVAHNGVEVVRGSASQEQVDNTETAENYAQNAPENIRDDNSEAINENEDSGILDNAGGEAGLNQTGANEPPATALSRIPVRLDENGQPVINRRGKPVLDYHKASLEDATDALLETTGGDMVMARDNAAILARNAEEKLIKLRKRRPKGEDPEELAYSSMQLKREIEEQQAIIKQWKDVATSIQKRMEKETAERRAAEEAAKSEEQRRIEAEEARVRKQQQDEAARKRLEEEIEKDRKRREKPYEPMVKARQEMAGDTDALSILDDTEPRSLEEYVSSSLRPHSILWLDTNNNERGLKSELGLNRSDMQRFMHLLGTKDSGAKSFDSVVVDIHQALPEGIKEQFTDADVRNVLLELFRSSENSTKMMNLTAENRIEEAREMMRENDRMAAEYEMLAWAEAYHLNPDEREDWEEFMSIPPTPIEQDVINQIIEEQYEQQNQGNGSLDQQSIIGTDTAGVEGGETEVRQETQATGGNNSPTEPEQAAEASTGEPPVAGNTVDGGVIPVPEVDMPRMQALRESLAEAYQSGEPGAIANAAKGIQDYVDEGLDDYSEFDDSIDEYDGNEPEKLADKYIARVFHDRYLDDDADQEYIITGLAANNPSTPIGATSSPEQITEQEGKVNTEPTDGQKEAGNYQKGQIKVDGYDITIENPKGSVRSGVDSKGNRWETPMNNTYGYIRGTEGVDGDHIDVFISDNPASGSVFVVDQVNPSTGEFDEHKVMYGFASEEEARQAYLSNYSKDWKGLGNITEVTRDEFKKWVESSHRKTKPFADYKSVKKAAAVPQHTEQPAEQPKRLVSDDRMEELKKRLRSKLGGQLNVGVDPEILAIGAEMAVGYIERGVTRFADYARTMIEEVGDFMRPYLKSFYNAVRDMPEAQEYAGEMDDYQTVSSFDVFNFDKQKQPTAMEKAEQVVKEQKVRRQARDIGEEKKRLDEAKKVWENLCNPKKISNFADDKGKQAEWVDAHLDEIVDAYINANGNKLDPDEFRRCFAAIGYDGKNVPDFREQEKRCVAEIYDRMLKKAVENGNASITLLTGVGGAGKSTATRNMDLGSRGVVYDSAFNRFEKLSDAIEHAKAAGMTDVQVIAVHNDALTAYSNVVNRGLATGRFIALKDFDEMYRENAKKIADLKEQHPDITITCYDNSGNKGNERPEGGRVSADEAAGWNYEIDIPLLNQLLDVLEDGINEGRFTEDQATSLGRGLRDLKRRGTEDEWRRVEERIERIERGIRGQADRMLRQEFSTQPGVNRGHGMDSTGNEGVQGLSSDSRLSDRGGSGEPRGVAQESPQQLDLFGNPIVSKQTKEKKGKDNGLLRDYEGVRSEGLPADRADGGGNVPGESETPGQESGGSDRSGETGSVGGSRQRMLDGLRSGDELNDQEKDRKNLNNNHAERGKDYAPKGVDDRIEANIAAIELMQKLMDEGRKATKKEMAVLRKFSGWGGLGKAFNTSDWRNDTPSRLKQLLGDEAYAQAEMSRNSAYFTPAKVIDALWDIARALGFKGGKVLEGSAGIGNILGLMPADMSERSDIQAVEIDQTTGNILSLLYPDAQVDIQGFEQTRVQNGSVDLAITNVPFVTGLHVIDESGDKDLSRKFRDIHDFCIAKNVRKLKPGGIGIFITSSGTLDRSQKLRDWLIGEGGADVVGAFRLNNTTFGGTAVTSDIIVVRKRIDGQRSANAIDVSTVTGERTATTTVKETDKSGWRTVDVKKTLTMDYNRYFMEHPEMMGGEMKFGFEKGDTYRPTSRGCYPVRGENQEGRLKSFVEDLAGKEWEKTAEPSSDTTDTVYDKLGEGVKEGSMLIDGSGRLCVATYGEAVPLDVNSSKVKGHTKQECFKSYSAVKDAVRAVLDYQTEHEEDTGLKPLLDTLNKVFDDFVNTYGHFYKNPVISFLKNDMDFSSIAALENAKERNDENGKRVIEYTKSDIFKKRVVEKETEPKPQTVKDGVITSIYKFGGINIGWMVSTMPQFTEQELRKEIVKQGLGFEDPLSREMIVTYEYLSGNVREKLRQAMEAMESGNYEANVRALEKVIPMNIPAHLIEFTIGSSWVEPKLFEDYIKERTGIDVKLSNVGGTWIVNAPKYGLDTEKNRELGVRSQICDKIVYGHELIAAAIQNRTVSVKKTTTDRLTKKSETITDQAATALCQSKIDEIRQDFKDWAKQKMQSDAELSERMEKEYNERFNNFVPKTIPDVFVPEHFGGAATTVKGRPFKLEQHQAKAAIRATTQNVMLAHEVGAGKTYTLITTAMEMRRLGTARKPMIVVQNATVGQFVRSAKNLYPNAKILTLEDADRTKEGRKAFYAKIKYNDWDMVVIPQSVLEMIPDSEERQMAYVQSKIEEKMMVLEQMRDAGADNQILKQNEREVETLREDLAVLKQRSAENNSSSDGKEKAKARQNAAVKAKEMLDRKVDAVENFDQMGIDALLVDEAHEYKHLGFATAMQRGVKGVDPSYSKEAQGVFLKCQSVKEKTGGKNVVFATGTPISNTAAEIWTFMRYLMPEDQMKEYGIYYFDDFVRNFGNLTQMLEFQASGKFKENNRFAGYVNLPELVRIWSGVADTVTSKEIEENRQKAGKESKLPEIEGGKAQDIYLPQSRALRSVMKYVKEELDKYDKMSGRAKKENSHKPVTMYGIAKAAAVDARLVVDDAEDDPNSKTNEAVRQTLKSLDETKDYNGIVAIFSDMYQNKHSGFNLYEDIRKKLIEKGVPAEQIVVMKSGMSVNKKLEIFDKCKAGEVRVILGSTFTLGTGVNIQERLHTLIHLDAPVRPMDYTQRNGRIVRQGNLHKQWGKPVRILRMGVEDSLDVTAYQRLKTKGAIADSIMKGKQFLANSMENRVMEEEEDVFGDTVAQLSGSEYAMLKQQAEREVRKLEAKQKQWEYDQTFIHNQKPRLRGLIAASKDAIEKAKKRLAIVEAATGQTITIGKLKFKSVDDMGDFIKDQNKKSRETEDRLRKSYRDEQSTSQLTVNVGGIDFSVKTELSKENERKGGTLTTVVKRRMSYSCAALGLDDVPVKQGLLRNAIEDITQNVMTGNDFRERIETEERSITRREEELEQLAAREGKPFEFAEALEKARERYDEYLEKMKEELAAKEAKYAEMDASVEASSPVEASEEEEDDVLNRADEDVEGPGADDELTELDVDSVEDMARAMHLDGRLEILTTTDGLEGKKARSKGWFNPKTGKIVIVLPNNISQGDVVKTLLHEGVAHYGLRNMFGEYFNEFLDNVYENVSPDIKARIDSAMKRNGWGRHEATEEYLARLAERTDFDNAVGNGWWQKIKNFFMDMMKKIGLHVTLSDNDLRYILWKSHDRLIHPDGQRNIFDKAREVQMKSRLRVGDYEPVATPMDYDSEERFRDDDSWSDDLAQRMYEQAVAESSLKWQEAWQDSMIGLKAIQDAIAKQTGNEAKGAENAYLFENRMHGRAKNMSEQYDWRFYKPMLKAFADFIKNREMTQEEGMDYLISKSGLERNVYYAMRDGFREKLTDEINDKREALEKEYSKGRISEDEYKEKKADLDEEERTGVDDRIKQFRGLLAYQRAKEDYQNGRIAYTEYLRRVESLLRSHLKRTKPMKDDEGNVISDNYYDDHAKDFSGLTETFAKELYDEAQTVKKEAQKTIDPQERRELWGKFNRLMQEAYITAREVAEDAVFAAENDGAAAEQQHTELWKKINDATKETLKQSYEMGLIDRDNYNKVREMFDYYIPLRGWEEDKASDVYTYMGRENVFSPAVKKTWGRTSQAENPLAYIGNIAVSTILSGHRNQMKQHFLNYVLNNPTSLVSISESWYENIGDQNGHAVWILRTADTAGKSADEIAQTVADFNEEMRLKQKEGKAMPVKGRLRLDVNATQGQKAEHVVEVQRAGRTYQLYINGNPKAAQALNGTHTKAVSRISDTYLGQHITALNRSMAAFFTSKNPAFVVSNLSRDLNMAGASVAIKEGADYNKRFIANVMKVLAPRIGESSRWMPASKQPTGMMPSLLRKWKKGTLDTNNDVERLFKEFMDEGGETGFVNMLSVDSFKEKMKKEIAQMNGCSLFGASVKAKETTAGKGLRLMGETFEFYNRCAEDATRFIVYMTSRQMGKTLEESIADAKDVTLNFNRKGTGGLGNAEVRDLFIFVNPAIQALANMYKMAQGKPLKFGAVTSAFVAGGMLMPIINQWLLNLFGDDDDKNTYWNLPPWVRKNNFVMWVPGTKNFITIPLAQEFRVFYGIGEMVASGVMDHPVNNMGLEIVSSVADLVPINPTGNGGNLMVDFAPTGVQPLMQIGENVDFTGKPIWKENQGNKEAPMYTKAYISTPDWMVRVSSAVNSITGGNEGRKGFLEKYLPFWGNYVNNPAVWNHLMQGYFGGMYNTIAKTVDVGMTAARGELPKIYQTPVINRFLNRPVERDNAGVLGEDYYSLTKERDEVMYELRTWRKKVTDLPADDPQHVKAQEHIDELTSSDRYKRAVTIGHYDKIIKDLKAGERAMKEGAPHKDKDLFDVHDQMDFYKQALLDDLRAIDEGKDPIDAAMERYDQAKTFAEKDKLKKHIERMIREKASGNATEGKSDVEKAKAYTEEKESDGGKANEIYLDHATSRDIRDDARIQAAKASIREHTDHYKKLLEKGSLAEAEKYRSDNRKYFDADMVIQTQSRLMERNKKLLGKGSDNAIMKLISNSRQSMINAIDQIR